MAGKAILVLCAQALLLKSALGQILGRAGGVPGLAPGIAPGLTPGLPGSYGASCAAGGGISSTGGGFAVSSFSPISPTGISVRSENAIEGSLTVGGEVPFLGAVALEGILPTAGAGAISYGCGNGAVGITSEGPIATGITTPGTYGPGVAGPAYGPGIGGQAYGPGISGPVYGGGIAGSPYGPGIAGTAYGPGVAPGLGYNGFGIGCGAY